MAITNRQRIDYQHGSFSLKCLITVGEPLSPARQEAVAVKWTKDGVDISRRHGFSRECEDYDKQTRTMAETMLMVTPITPKVEGFYECHLELANQTYIGGTYVRIAGKRIFMNMSVPLSGLIIYVRSI